MNALAQSGPDPASKNVLVGGISVGVCVRLRSGVELHTAHFRDNAYRQERFTPEEQFRFDFRGRLEVVRMQTLDAPIFARLPSGEEVECWHVVGFRLPLIYLTMSFPVWQFTAIAH